MPHRIRNFDALARSKGRTDTLSMIEEVYAHIETDQALKRAVYLKDDDLVIGGKTFRLADYEHVYIVGCGKIACQAAVTLEHILQERIRDGAVIGVAKHACDIVSVYEGTHPMPSVLNFDASDHMMRIGAIVTEKDLVLSIVGGGGSALLCSSQGECDQTGRLYTEFLKTGGTINELNIVRRHLSPLKGGGLAKILFPATVVGLIFSDVSDGDLATVASGPTYPDASTVADAQAIIDRYKLGSYRLHETTKDPRFFEKVHNIPIVTNKEALLALTNAAEQLGYRVVHPDCDPYATPEVLFECLQRAAVPNSAVIFSGEVRLSVPEGMHGSGGRSSMLALHALSHTKEGQTFASFASDGHDNGAYAGAIIDLESLRTLREQGVDVGEYIRRYDANAALKISNDLIETGTIEANVADLAILLTS